MEKETGHLPSSIQKFISEGTCQAIRDRYARLSDHAREADFGELDRNVVVLDTETTGFSVKNDELIQIAAARMERGRIEEWFVCYVDPGRPIPEEITHLTGISDADVAGAPSPEEALSQLVAFVGSADIVAHNAEFDCNFTTKSMYGAALLENSWIDSLDLARIALPRMKSHRLLDLVRAFDAPLSTHRADADVEALCVVYRLLLAAVDAMPLPLVQEIAGMATEQEWPTVKVFRLVAERRAAAGEAAPDGGDDTAPAPAATPSFSLRALRRQRLSDLPRKTKEDADEIAASPERELVFPKASEIAQAFEPDGLVGRLYGDYETRNEQVQMAEKIRQAFASSTNLAVEAGTGVGKSMAYLAPAAMTAMRNGITLGVATKTNALLDQLMYKELPLLAGSVAEGAPGLPAGPAGKAAEGGVKPPALEFASLKGFSHYPCLRSINRIVQEGPRVRQVNGKDIHQAPSLAALLSFVEQSEYDDIDTLKIDYRALPRYAITTSSHDCLRRKCPFYGAMCFVHGARRRAESVDIVVTNHSLLFCDIAADGGLLPPVRYWIVDEAHGAEAEARAAFSLELSAEEILRLARRVSADEAGTNVLIRAERRAADAVDANTLHLGLFAKARSAGKAFEQAATDFCAHIKDLAFFDTNRRNKGYETVELWINDDIRGSETFGTLVSFGRVLADTTEKLIAANQEIVGILDDIEEAAEAQREIAAVTINLKELLNAIETIMFTAPPLYAYSATLSKKSDRVVEKLQALLISVGDKMNETLYANTHSVVFASATLTVADSFDSFETALGLNEGENSQTTFSKLDSSYDFDSQMTVYVAEDMPEPNDPAYLASLQRLLIDVHRAQQGSLLTLFTNRKEMEKCFDIVQPALKAEGLRLVCQKWGVSAKGLRDEFLVDEHLSLFALKSFWEGFDAPGTTLKGVIIPKLPFAKPTDPLSCERALLDQQAWSHYVLPAAVLETKQAAGRLIRKADDEGCLILADKRLVSKGYGKAFLKSLPSRTIKICSSAAIAKELAEANERPSSIQ